MKRAIRALCAYALVIVPSMTAMAQSPGQVSYIQPSQGATGTSVTPTFKWFTEALSDDYRLTVSTTASTAGQVVNQIVADTLFTPGDVLDNGRTYYWSVSGRNVNGEGPDLWWPFVTVTGGVTQVSLTSPSNGATNAAVDPILSWGSVNGAASYHLQVSTSSDFGTTVVDNSSIAGTQFQPTLDAAETYFWRVRTSNGGEFNWSDTWSFETGPGIPDKIVLTSPADGATDVSSTPLLSWQADPAATAYRVRVATSRDFVEKVADVVVATTSWTPPPLANAKVHYWLVRGNSPSGNGRNSNIWSFTTESGGPTQVQLSAPSNGATDVVLNPVLTWSGVTAGAPYRLQVSKTSDFSTIVIDDSGVATTQYDTGALDPNTTYHWRVLASSGAPDNWSDAWSFETGTGLPGQVVLVSPVDGAVDVPTTPNYSWQAAPSSDSYRLQVSKTSDFAEKVINFGGITETSVKHGTLEPGTEYFWRVRGVNSGGSGQYSVPFSFTTGITAPGQVTLTAPANQATNVSETPLVAWEVDAESDSYDVQIATTEDFAAPVVSAIGLTENEFTSTALANGTPHFWRVRGANGAGKGPWSEVFTFTTIPGGAQQVILVSPLDGAEDVGLSPLLTWGAVTNAASYALQVSLQSNFSSTEINRDAVTTTQFQTSTLAGQTKFYWRVRASNAGPANWSATWSFTTSSGTPDQVVLLSPADKAQNVTVNTVLMWNQALKADTYELQMTETEDDYSVIYYEASNIVGTQHQVPELVYGDVYWWRVRAVNDSGPGEWSKTWGYLTERGGEDQPLIVSPLPGATGVSLEPLLVWSSVPDDAGKTGLAVTYHVQIATSFSFTGGSIVMEETAHPDTSFQVTGLLPDTTYAWRVRASTAGPNNWTITSSFVTGKGVPGQVVLESPTHGSIEIPLETQLQWTVPIRATSFNLQVSLDSAFTSVIVSETGLSDIKHTLTDLDPMTEYYWRVQALNQDGIGEWSEKWSFATVGLSAPTAPVLISPLNGASEVSHMPLFTWNASETATSYKLEISTTPVFSTVTIAVVVTQPFYQAEGLLVGQSYFWRVEARNAGGSSVSDIWGFETVQTTDTESDEIPGSFALEQNYPNPFNPSTTLEFSMPQGTEAQLIVYNVRGEEVARLVDGYVAAGQHRVVWNAADHPSGVYLYRFQAGEFVSTKKLTLAK